MASQVWIYNLPLAVRTLIPEFICQETLKQNLEEIAAEFTWLSEIVVESSKLFSVRSLKLEHMPPTPSMKQRVQERNRQKVEVAKEKAAHDSGPVPPKVVPQILKIESSRKTVSTNTALNGSNQTLSNYHKTTKAGWTENNRLSKRTSQQSVKQFSNIKSSEFNRSAKLSSVQKGNKENKVPVRKTFNEKQTRRHDDELREAAKFKASVSTTSEKVFEMTSLQMKECVTACENVLNKHGTSRGLANLGTTNRMDGSRSKFCYNQGTLGEISSHQFHLSMPCSRKNLQQNAEHRIKQDQYVYKFETEQNSNIESRSLVPGMNKTNQFIASNEQNKDIYNDVATGRLSDIQTRQCQYDALNETVTVITEVFEIVDKGQPARLKEFEIVKTKTAPVSQILKSQAELTDKNSYPSCLFRTGAQKESSAEDVSIEVTRTKLGQSRGVNKNQTSTVALETQQSLTEEPNMTTQNKFRKADILKKLAVCNNDGKINTGSHSMCRPESPLKLIEKENRHKERLRKAAELRKQKTEEHKKLREEKEQRITEAREMRWRNEQEKKEKINKRLEAKVVLKDKLMQEQCKEDQDKEKQRLKKQTEINTLIKEEAEERFNKVNEQDEDARIQEKLKEKKTENEEVELKRQNAEERKKQEENWAEFEQKRKEEKLRLKQAEELKEQEREHQRIEKEKQIAYKRAEQERIDREEKEKKDRKIQEELEKLKAMERERLRLEQERKQMQQQQYGIQQISKDCDNISEKPLNTNIVNTTQTLCNIGNCKITSYDMTPVKQNIANNKFSNADNYDIEDKDSDESTDDEEAPKKKIPEWATGIPLNTALIRQILNPPDLEEIFRISKIEPPELVLVFRGRWRPRYKLRTSSAVWNSPPLTQR